MEIGAVIIGVLIIVVLFVIIAIDNSGNANFDAGLLLGMILSVLMAIEVILLSAVLEDPKPTAMDVYQDKTTLEYTIRDSIKIDSIVVWKEEKKYEKND